MANLATKAAVEGRQQLQIHAPLITFSKAQIIQQGTALGVDYGITTSCYDPGDDGSPCRQCDSCQLRAKGFAEAGLLDPLRARSDEPAPTTFRVRLGCRRDWFDRNGLRLARNLPVPDTDKGARSDMEALGPLVEVGAGLMVDLWRCVPRDHSFSFNVPLGLVYSVGVPY
jgi:hypothetical protein